MLEQALLSAMIEARRNEGIGLGLMFAYFAVISEISTLDHKANSELIGIPEDLDMSDFPIDKGSPMYELLDKYPSKVKPFRTKVVITNYELDGDSGIPDLCWVHWEGFYDKELKGSISLGRHLDRIEIGKPAIMSISFNDGVNFEPCEI